MYIRSGMNPDLVLSAQGGNVVLAWIDLNDTTQQWTLENHNQFCRITNVATQTGITVSSVSEGAGLIVSGTGALWQIVGDGAFQAIRNSQNFDLNFNSPGGNMGVGTQIVLWGWSGGDPNEIWQVENASDISPFSSQTVQLFAGAGSATGLMWDGGRFTVEHQGIPSQNPAYLFTVTQWSTGVSFYNQAANAYLIYQGDRTKVGISSGMIVQALWTYGANSSSGYRAVRPWLNDDMNLNVFGDDYPKAGSDVGVWNWGGGEDNEVWTVMSEPVGHVMTHREHHQKVPA